MGVGFPPFAVPAEAKAAADAAAAAASQAAVAAMWPKDVSAILEKAAEEGVQPPHPDVNNLPLTDRDRAVYKGYVNDTRPGDTQLFRLQGTEVSVSDMRKLAPNVRLNDTLITIYAMLLQMRADRTGQPVCILPASWYTMLVTKNGSGRGIPGAAKIQLSHWGKASGESAFGKATQNDIATCNQAVWGVNRRVLVPVKEEGHAHWLMTAIDVGRHRFSFYDSFLAHDSEVKQDRTKKVQGDIMEYLRAQMPALGFHNWTSEIVRCPIQKGGTDCGVFMLHFLRCVAECRDPYMEQAGVGDMRVRLVLEIINLIVL